MPLEFYFLDKFIFEEICTIYTNKYKLNTNKKHFRIKNKFSLNENINKEIKENIIDLNIDPLIEKNQDEIRFSSTSKF